MKPCPPEFAVPDTLRGRFGYDAIVSLDCEYVARPASRVPEAPGRANDLLSYQAAVVLLGKRGEADTYFEQISYFGSGLRPTLGGLLSKWIPTGVGRVLLVWHNGLAELAHLLDKRDVMMDLQFVQKNPVTFDPFYVALVDGREVSVELNDGREVLVSARDTMLLAPQGGKALKKVAEQNQKWRKCDLADLVKDCVELQAALHGQKPIERMDLVRRHAPREFEEYALHDVRAALEYFLGFHRKVIELFDVDRAPMTVVGLAALAFDRWIAKRGGFARLDRILGQKREVSGNQWGSFSDRARVAAQRKKTEPIATEAYAGGFNAPYRWGEWGPKPGWVVLDLDMAGAYATTMAWQREIDWDSITDCADATTLAAMDYSWASVVFSFPPTEWNPCLAVNAGGPGLIYPLTGETTCTGLELRQALDKGAEISVVVGGGFMAKDNPVFAEWLREVAIQRAEAQARGDHFADLLFKLVLNGFYGKLGQGIKLRVSRHPGNAKRAFIPTSKVTCEQYASYTTALVRVCLIALIDRLHAAGAVVMSATTDGVMVAVPESWITAPLPDKKIDVAEVAPHILELIADHWAWKFFAEGRRRLDQTDLLVVKQWGDSCLTIKTRVNAIWRGDRAINAAWTGRKLYEDDSVTVTAAEMRRMFRNDGFEAQTQRRMMGVREVFNGADLTTYYRDYTLNLNPDYKRALLADGSSVPHPSFPAFVDVRHKVDQLYRRGVRATWARVQCEPIRRSLQCVQCGKACRPRRVQGQLPMFGDHESPTCSKCRRRPRNPRARPDAPSGSVAVLNLAGRRRGRGKAVVYYPDTDGSQQLLGFVERRPASSDPGADRRVPGGGGPGRSNSDVD